jgi:hypothetical protein
VAGGAGFLKNELRIRINVNKMKRVVINTYQIGLVFRNGAYLRMLKAAATGFGRRKR